MESRSQDDKPFDLTKFVKSFELTLENSFKLITDGESMIFEYQYKPPNVINLTFEHKSIATQKMFDFASKQVMKMEQHGRFWFDRAFEADVIMTGLTLEPDGIYTATYESMSINDKTNHGLLARFLRWILRR